MNESQIALLIVIAMIVAMAVLLYRKDMLSITTMVVAIVVTVFAGGFLVVTF